MAAANSLTAARLREVLHYESLTGVFTWLVQTQRLQTKVGDVAGGIKPSGYVCIGIDGKRYRAHRLAWLWMTGQWPVDQIDHINGIRSDNRLSNLREASRSLNSQNQRRAYSNNKTGFLGVSWSKQAKKYHATIMANGNDHHLGYFTTPELAYTTYLTAKRKLHEGNTL